MLVRYSYILYATVYFFVSSVKIARPNARSTAVKLVTRIRIFRTYDARKETKKEDSAYCISTRLQFESFITLKRIREESKNPVAKASRVFKITVKSFANRLRALTRRTNLFRTRESQRTSKINTCLHVAHTARNSSAYCAVRKRSSRSCRDGHFQ